jgi:hypothetical protein
MIAGDITEKILRMAYAHYGRRIPLEVFDAQELPFKAGSAEVIILFEAIYYLSCAQRFLTECKRVLKQGGRVLIATANKDLYDFNPSPFSHQYYGVRELKDLFSSVGFDAQCYGYLSVRATSLRQRLTRPLKRVAVMLNVIPKTSAGKRLLKKMVFGGLIRMPTEIMGDAIGYVPPRLITASLPDREHKVLYCIGTLR